MANWQPDNDGLSQVIDFVKIAGRPDRYQEMIQRLGEYNEIPDFNNYLCFVFVYCESERPETRMMAAVILRDNVARHWRNLLGDVQQYIMIQAPNMLAHPDAHLRELCGGIITVILAQTKISGWPEIINNLIGALDNDNPLLLQGTFSTLDKICEDHGRELSQPHPELAEHPLNILIPKLLNLMATRKEDLVYWSLKCIVHLITWKHSSILLSIKDFLQLLFGLADDPPSVKVLDMVCRTFTALVFAGVSAIMEHMDNIVQYMLMMTNSENGQVALTASNFWSVMSESEICEKALGHHLPAVVETLLKNMRYSEEELIDLEDFVEEDAATPDRPENTVPTTGKMMSGDSVEASYDTSLGVSEWNLRKSCGQALDDLTNAFSEEILDVIIPLCQQGLQSPEWLDREACTLALGATSRSFLSYGSNYLIDMVPILIGLQDDPRPLIRYSASWATSRYASWIVAQGDELMQPAIDTLLRRLTDRSKKVVEAAASALAIMAEEAGADIAPYLETMLPTYMAILPSLHGRTSMLMLDAIGALCESSGEALNQPHLLELLMPPLITKWNETDDHDQRILPLIDCITRIALGLRSAFANFAEGVWERPIRLTQHHIMMRALSREQPNVDEPDPRFLACSLELMSGIVEALGAGAADLVANSNLVSLLVEAVQETAPAALRASLCLVGDLAVHTYVHLIPGIEALMPVLITNIRPRAVHVSISINAAWATGEIVLRAGEQMLPWADEICKRTIMVIHDHTQHANFHNNAAILLGRLGMHFPQIVAVNMENFIGSWCILLSNLEDDDDKKSAFFGLANALKANPASVLNEFDKFVYALNSWDAPPTALKSAFIDLLAEYKMQLGQDTWEQVLSTVPDHELDILARDYPL